MSSSSPRSTGSKASSGSASGFGRFRRVLLDHVSFNTPRARALNFATILATLALWPSDRLNQMPVRSVWVTVFGWEPYSTGMMRALSRLLHGDLEGAWAYNPLAFAALAIMMVLAAKNGLEWLRGRHVPAP